ncbi:MAG: hypothetical protein OHK0029_23030 [Armatimonadaceae bacterium]
MNRFLLVITLLLSTEIANAQPFQFDNVVYDLPNKEWKRGRTYLDHIILYDKGMDAYIRVFRSAPLPEDLGIWAVNRLQKYDQAKAQEDNKKPPEIVKTDQKTTVQNGKNLTLISQILDTGRRKRLLRVAVVIPAGKKADLITFESNDPQVLQQRSNDFTRFIEQVKQLSGGAKPVIGKPTPGKLQGIWFGNKVGYGLDGTQVQTQFYLFSPSGRFVSTIIDGEPLSPFDFERAVRLHPGDGGNYLVRNGKLLLHYADGEKDEYEFERSTTKQGKPALKIAGTYHVLVKPPSNGARLQGTYSSVFYSSFTPGSGVSGGVSSSRTYTFKKDGTFISDRFAGASGNFENGSGDTTGGFTTGKTTDNAGTYRIENGLLILKEKDGKEVRRNIVIAEEGLVFIDGSTYLDRTKKN